VGCRNGIPILTVADRSGARLFEILPRRTDAIIGKALTPLIPTDAVLCSDGASRYKYFAAKTRMEHFVLGSKPRTRMASPSHHIQNVNALHSRYDGFIRPFCGPAKKYLGRYVQWFVARQMGAGATTVMRTL
jgi:hypothetical protein